MGHTRRLLATVRDEFPDFIVLSGYDENLAHVMLSDGNGCIGGLSNLYPEVFAKWVKAINEKDMDEVTRIQKIVDRMMTIYEVGTPFIPVMKRAMTLRGINLVDYSIKPFLEVNDKQEKEIKAIIEYVEKNF